LDTTVPSDSNDGKEVEGEWKAVEGSAYFESPKLYKENGFREKKDAQELIHRLSDPSPIIATIAKIEKKKENKNPPLLYNLAELQNDCSKIYKLSPDQTLKVAQELYEKKLLTYPRTDARVLSTAVAKEIEKNLRGLTRLISTQSKVGNAGTADQTANAKGLPQTATFAQEILQLETHKNIAKTKYVNDKQITDHYAIIPTGQGLGALKSLSPTALSIYERVVRRFLSIFYPAAVYQKIGLVTQIQEEKFFTNFKTLVSLGYLKVLGESIENQEESKELWESVLKLKKGMELPISKLSIKEGETSPPKRYTSGSLILAMESAGKLIEDEELREQIKDSGIGTSATRAEILNKLVHNKYLSLNKTQLVTPTLLGELIYDVVDGSIRSLLNPELTASWEKGLNYVAQGSITPEEYQQKLDHFVRTKTNGVLELYNQGALAGSFRKLTAYY
jgi:DNA topoisomerase-3